MERWRSLVLLLALLAVCRAAPVLPEKTDTDDEGDIEDSEHTGLEYDRYLRKVVKTLENDPVMKKKLDDLSLDDLKTGKMMEILDGVSDKMRARLDDLKRSEIQRLRQVARQRFQQATDKTKIPQDIQDMHAHIDVYSRSFGSQDLSKLLKKATEDLDKADKERKEEFKRYEMQKEIERRQKLKEMDEAKRKEAEQEHEERRKKLKEKHMKHPGSKPQLEDVWEETDHLEREDFNPRTFFNLHDTNGDGTLDAFELEALFVKQVEKMYAERHNSDPREKFEEISRMREHVMNEIDKNKDKMVSRKEFMEATEAEDFDEDKGWDDLEEQDIYTEDELETYEKNIQEEMKKLKLRLQQEHDQYKENRVPQPGDPVVMNQAKAAISNPQQLADQVIQAAADHEAEKFHQASQQMKKLVDEVANQVKANAQGGQKPQDNTQHQQQQQQ